VKYELLLRGRAKSDIRRAAKWYERQREGLGRDFVAEVDAALALIEAHPEKYQIVHREIRHAICAGFLTVFSTEFELLKSEFLPSCTLNGTTFPGAYRTNFAFPIFSSLTSSNASPGSPCGGPRQER
jgi:hypothetical protein